MAATQQEGRTCHPMPPPPPWASPWHLRDTGTPSVRRGCGRCHQLMEGVQASLEQVLRSGGRTWRGGWAVYLGSRHTQGMGSTRIPRHPVGWGMCGGGQRGRARVAPSGTRVQRQTPISSLRLGQPSGPRIPICPFMPWGTKQQWFTSLAKSTLWGLVLGLHAMPTQHDPHGQPSGEDRGILDPQLEEAEGLRLVGKL